MAEPQETDVQATTIQHLVNTCRSLKARQAEIESQLADAKDQLFTLISISGSYTDAVGYARIQSGKAAGWKVDAGQINKLKESWLASSNDTIRSCGLMLDPHVSPTEPGKPYLAVK